MTRRFGEELFKRVGPFVGASKRLTLGISDLFRDEFKTIEDPVTFPRDAEPKGVWTVTGDSTRAHIDTPGVFEIDASGSALTLETDQIPFEEGLTLEWTGRVPSMGASTARVGLTVNLGTFQARSDQLGAIQTPTNSLVNLGSGEGLDITDATFKLLRDADGRLFYIKNDVIRWVGLTALLPNDYKGTIFDNPATFNGIFTSPFRWYVSSIIPSPIIDADPGVNGTIYTSDADVIIDLEVTAPNPLADTIGLKFRAQDANNCYHIYFDASGNFKIDRLGSSPATLTTIAGAITAGATRTLRVICRGTSVYVWRLSGTSYSAPYNFTDSTYTTETDHIPVNTGSGVLGRLRAWNRNFPVTA